MAFDKEEARLAHEAVKEEMKSRKSALKARIREKIPEISDRKEIENCNFDERQAEAAMHIDRAMNMGLKNKVVIGQVSKGQFRVGDAVYISSDFSVIDRSVITDIAQFGRHFDIAPTGAMVQIALDAPNVIAARRDVLFKLPGNKNGGDEG